MSESRLVTACPRAEASLLKASPHIRRNAIENATARLLPTAPSTTAKYRPRAKTHQIEATYATTTAATSAAKTNSFRVKTVSTISPNAARAAPMANVPLLPMRPIIPERAAASARNRA